MLNNTNRFNIRLVDYELVTIEVTYYNSLGNIFEFDVLDEDDQIISDHEEIDQENFDLIIRKFHTTNLPNNF